MRGVLALVIAPLAACAAATGVAGGLGSGASPGGPREDRVIVPTFVDVTGVAVSQRTVFIATAGALGMYNRLSRRWAPPITAAEGFPGDPVSYLVADSFGDGAWVGTAIGAAVYYYDATLSLLTRAFVPGRVEEIAFDSRSPASDAYVRAGGVWSTVSRNGATAQLVGAPPASAALLRPITLPRLHAEYASLRTIEPVLTRDAFGRSWPVVAGSRGQDRFGELWLGTFGNGVYDVDPNLLRATHHPFGLAGRGAGALARTADGIWIAPRGEVGGSLTMSSARGALTLASEDLQRWRWIEADPLSGAAREMSGARSYALLARGPELWVATDRGVAVLSTGDRATGRLLTASNGLPDERVFALAEVGTGQERHSVVAGTARGTALIAGTTDAVTRGPVTGGAVRALVSSGDSLWIGSDDGLLLATNAARDDVAVRRISPRPIRALAMHDSLLIAAGEGELFRVSADVLVPLYPAVDFRAAASITAVAVDQRSVCVAGALGMVVVARTSGTARFLRDAGDIYAVLLTDDFIWLGTRDGLVRLRRLGESVR